MKRLLMTLPLLLVVGQAAAMERHDMTKMTCEELQAALRSEKEAVLMSPSSKVPGMMRFDKYVIDPRVCGAPPMHGKDASVKTGDGQSCLVYRCVQITSGTPRT
jgi:hypothetical protein